MKMMYLLNHCFIKLSNCLGYLFFFTVLIAIQSCKEPTEINNYNLVGHYKSNEGSLLDKVSWYINDGTRSYNVSTDLTLYENNQFSLKGCTCLAKGEWSQNNDTLTLNSKSLTVLDHVKNDTFCRPGRFTFTFKILNQGKNLDQIDDLRTRCYLKRLH